MHQHTAPDARRVVVIGGGLAGLTAAAAAADHGAHVTVLEGREHAGGRARTAHVDGFLLNQGAHALYRGGPAWRTLHEFGITPQGNSPDTAGTRALRADGTLAPLPTALGSLVGSPLLGARGKVQLARVLARVPRLAESVASGASAQQWIDDAAHDRGARALLHLLLRTATYCDDLDRLDAVAALRQLAQVYAHGVVYLDGGFQQLVDALRRVADSRGVTTRTRAKVAAVDSRGDAFVVRTADGDIDADAVVVAAGGPSDADRLVHGRSDVVRNWAATEVPVYATALDVALRALPVPDRRVVFGLDAPLYFSVHTPAAKLTSGPGEVAHLLWYGESAGDTADAAGDRLEQMLDRVQPGWRDEVVDVRYGRRLVVAHGRPLPGRGSTGRPTTAVPDAPGLFVAGDWVGPEGLLTDAVMASGMTAGAGAARHAAAKVGSLT